MTDDTIITLSDQHVRLQPDTLRVGVTAIDDGVGVLLTVVDPKLGEFAIPLDGEHIAYLLESFNRLAQLTPDNFGDFHTALKARIEQAEAGE